MIFLSSNTLQYTMQNTFFSYRINSSRYLFPLFAKSIINKLIIIQFPSFLGFQRTFKQFLLLHHPDFCSFLHFIFLPNNQTKRHLPESRHLPMIALFLPSSFHKPLKRPVDGASGSERASRHRPFSLLSFCEVSSGF